MYLEKKTQQTKDYVKISAKFKSKHCIYFKNNKNDIMLPQQ